MTRKGGTGVVVPGWQLLVRGQLSPFLFVFGIFFCLVPARWHFVTDFSICLRVTAKESVGAILIVLGVYSAKCSYQLLITQS